MKTVVIALLIGCGCVLAAVAQTKQPLPGRAPMHSHLLAPSAEWNAYYDVAPESERSLYWTAKTLIDVARQQQARITELEKRVAELEKQPLPIDVPAAATTPPDANEGK